MKFVRRYLFSCFFGGIILLIIFGWWSSTRQWTAWNAETPYGIFKVQSESSIFGIGAQFMNHDHPWSAHRHSDPVTGDEMKWLFQLPRFSAGEGLYFLILPYWELMLFFLGCGGAVFAMERRKIIRHLAAVDPDSAS